MFFCQKKNPCTIKILYKTIFQYKSSWKAENAQLRKYYFPVGKLFFFNWKIIFSQLGLFLPPFLSVFAHFDQLWLILLTANKSLQLRDVLKILDLSFYLFWCSQFRPLFVSFGVILSSLISHIARYVPSSTYKSTHENRTKINAT